VSIVGNQVQTVVVPGELDHTTTDSFEQAIRQAVATGPKTVRLDCHAMERVVSSHITLLWTAREVCHRSGVTMELTEPPDALIRILGVLDLADIFEYDRPLPDRPHSNRPAHLSRAESQTFRAQPRIDRDSIDHMIIQFLVFLNDLRVDPAFALELQTLVYEIATNVRLHSGLGPDTTFQFAVTADADALTMTFTDTGRAFDPVSAGGEINPRAASQSGKKRGYGLPIIHRLADDIVYCRTDQSCNVLTITKSWR